MKMTTQFALEVPPLPALVLEIQDLQQEGCLDTVGVHDFVCMNPMVPSKANVRSQKGTGVVPME